MDQIKDLENNSFKPKISEKSKEIVRIRDKKAFNYETDNHQNSAAKNNIYAEVTIGNTDCKLAIKKPSPKQVVQSKPKPIQAISPSKSPSASNRIVSSSKKEPLNRSKSRNNADAKQSTVHQETSNSKQVKIGKTNNCEGVQYHDITYEDGGLDAANYNDTIDLMR